MNGGNEEVGGIEECEMMKEIFKELYIPEYNSSSESGCDDDKDDNSVEEDHVQIVTYRRSTRGKKQLALH
ncbi:hypothetical protein Tco_0559951 [Tanacetum coccineum]